MFSPKCYTLINKLYDPKKDIRENRLRLNVWSDKLDDTIPDLVEFNRVYENIHMYIDCDTFPDIDIPFYSETVDGWKLIRDRNRLKKMYPIHLKQVLNDVWRESLIEAEKDKI